MTIKREIFLYCVLGLLCLFLACQSINYDWDLFARLIVGERIVEHGILPFRDFLSYTPTHAWYDHEWGSGLIFYLLLKHLGPLGLLLMQAVTIFGTAFFVIKTQQLQKHAFPTSLIFMTIFCVIFSNFNSELVRCQLFTFFFFSLFLYFCEKNKKTGSNLIWLAPLIVIIWNNLHGGIVSGLGLLFIYFIGSILEKTHYKKYLAVLCVSAPLLIINPYGYKYLSFLLQATTMQRKYIIEWWPFYHSYHRNIYMPISLLLCFGYISFLIKGINRKNLTKLIVLTVTLVSGLAHVKLLTLALITIAALCYNDIMSFFLRFKKYFIIIEKSLYAVIIVLSLTIPLYSPWAARADVYKLPLYEVEFLRINNIKGNIVTPFAYGSYVSYKLYPNNLIYMDGRYEEVYDNALLEALRNYELIERNWQDVMHKYNTDILMPDKGSKVYYALIEDENWDLIFDGRNCGIFVKNGERKFSYYEPDYNIDYYRKTMFDGYFGSKLRRQKWSIQ